MKSFRKELFFSLPARRGFLNITPHVYGEFDGRRRKRVLVKILGE